MTHCPNCGTAWLLGTDTCAHCGYVRPGASSWPPTPLGQISLPPPPVPPLITGKFWGDMILGVSMSLASFAIFCLGFIVMPILYFSYRAQYPVVARGIGYWLLGGIVVLLGALSICLHLVDGTGH